MIEEDLTIFFDDFAQRVSALGIVVENGGILDMPMEYVGPDGDVMVTDYMLTVRTDQFGGLKLGDVVDIDSTRFRVRRDARQRDDGKFSVVDLIRLRDIGYSPEEVG